MHELPGENRGRVRRRFLVWSFVAGACVPPVWICAPYALPSWSVPSGLVGSALFAVACATFPTKFLFLDTEHLPEIIFMLVIAMPLNGAWFTLVGLGFWNLRGRLSRPTPN